MATLFGAEWSRADLDRVLPDVAQIAGIRHVTVDDGTGGSMRVIQIESGGGLRIDLLPDRCCDIGQVWCKDVPFCWIGPMGLPLPQSIKANSPLAGLMVTCGFDHIRQPERDNGRDFPLHGSMMHMPARIVSAEAVWKGDECTFTVVAEVTQFALDRGAVRLYRRIEVPLGGTSLKLSDRVRLMSGSMALMGMYHINLGFPLVTPQSVVTLCGRDITASCLGQDIIATQPSGEGIVTAELAGSEGPTAPRFTLSYDAGALPVLQTLRNSQHGVNLFCLEPATHDRKPRKQLRDEGALTDQLPGAELNFELEMRFDTGH